MGALSSALGDSYRGSEGREGGKESREEEGRKEGRWKSKVRKC